MEINSPNCQYMHWIREMLQQGMVVARQTTDTYIVVVLTVSMMSYIFLFDTVCVPVFTCQKNESKTDSLYRCARLTAYRCTRLIIAAQC